MKPLHIAFLLLLAACAAYPEELLLRGATVHTVTGGTLSPGDVRVKDGKIVEVGQGLDAGSAPVVDLTGLHLYPGLINPMSSLGLHEIGAVRPTNDTSEVGGWSPALEALIAVNADSELIPVVRANGYTHALAIPMGGTVPGHSAVIRLSGWNWEEMAVSRHAALHVFWPSMELDLRSKEEARGGEQKDPAKQAEERRARLKELDAFFDEAAAYRRGREAAAAGKPGIGDGERVPAWEAMLPALRGEVPLFLHAGEERQIRAAVAWAKGRGLTRCVIAGGRDAWRCAALLAEAKFPVVYDSTFGLPPRDTDPYDAQYAAAAVLAKAGVAVAFSNGPGGWAAADARNIPYHAAQSAAFGLDREEALRGLTIHPARILGVEAQLGSIERGKEASLIAVAGDILDIRSEVRRMWIAGRETPLESRHTRLWERYRRRAK